jgi:lipoate-protein ligase B
MDYEPDVHWYVRQLEKMTINLLSEYDLFAATAPGRTGVWLGDQKIAAIGVGIRKWVTYHGLALNGNNDLSPFQYIIPCGLKDFGVTSMSERLGCKVSMTKIREDAVKHFARTFEADLLEISLEDLTQLIKF